MTRRNGRGFSSAEKTELWDRWQRGESLKAIGRVFGKPSSSFSYRRTAGSGLRHDGARGWRSWERPSWPGTRSIDGVVADDGDGSNGGFVGLGSSATPEAM